MVYWSQVRVFNGFKNIMRRKGSRGGLHNYYSLFALILTCTTRVTKRMIFKIFTIFQAKHFICAPSLKMVLLTVFHRLGMKFKEWIPIRIFCLFSWSEYGKDHGNGGLSVTHVYL